MEGSVLRMGPCGGGGGHERDMDMRGVNRVVKVVVRHGDTVDAISVLYERNGREEWTDLWGGQGGELSEICLQPDEHFTGVVGHFGEFDGSFAVRSLTFVSNRRSFGPYGQEDGVPFSLPAAGGKILGFHGRSGRRLDALGTYVKMADKLSARRKMAEKSAPTTPRSPFALKKVGADDATELNEHAAHPHRSSFVVRA